MACLQSHTHDDVDSCIGTSAVDGSAVELGLNLRCNAQNHGKNSIAWNRHWKTIPNFKSHIFQLNALVPLFLVYSLSKWTWNAPLKPPETSWNQQSCGTFFAASRTSAPTGFALTPTKCGFSASKHTGPLQLAPILHEDSISPFKSQRRYLANQNRFRKKNVRLMVCPLPFLFWS